MYTFSSKFYLKNLKSLDVILCEFFFENLVICIVVEQIGLCTFSGKNAILDINAVVPEIQEQL
jgi:hypothetical protein